MYELIGRRIAACLLVLGCIVLTDMASAQPTDLKISWEVRNRFRLFREQSIRLDAALKPTYIFAFHSLETHQIWAKLQSRSVAASRLQNGPEVSVPLAGEFV